MLVYYKGLVYLPDGDLSLREAFEELNVQYWDFITLIILIIGLL